MRYVHLKHLGLIAAALVALALLNFDLPRILFHRAFAHQSDAHAQSPSLGLPGYRAVIEARPIAGLSRNLSGLTFSPQTHTLFATINRPATLVELSLEGDLLRQFPLPSIRDAEGIAHVEGDRFLISDECDSRIHWVRIPESGDAVTLEGAITLPSAMGTLRNLGLEGLSWDQTHGELLVANEKWPARVLAIRGIQPGATSLPETLDARRWKPLAWLGTLGGDLASLHVHERTGNLLALSEESAVLTEYSRDGHVLGVMTLWSGSHDLNSKVPQPEGITTGPDDTIYLISEPNLFYRFAPDTDHTARRG